MIICQIAASMLYTLRFHEIFFSYFRHQLRNKLSSISSQLGLTVLEIQEDMCTADNQCQHGECRFVKSSFLTCL